MRHEFRAEPEVIDSFQMQYDDSIRYLREHWLTVRDLLPFITELKKDELQFVEDYFTLKYQALPSIKDFLRNPILISYDEVGEILTNGDTNDEITKELKQDNKRMGTAACAKGNKACCGKGCKKKENVGSRVFSLSSA